jgi:hypothetical protein
MVSIPIYKTVCVLVPPTVCSFKHKQTIGMLDCETKENSSADFDHRIVNLVIRSSI